MATTVTLSDEQLAFVKQRLAGGAFPNAEAVIAASLLLLANAHLRELAPEGIDAIERGEFTVIPPGGVTDYVNDLRDRVRRGSQS